MALTEAFSGSETISTTEHSLVTDTSGPDESTADHAIQIVLDMSALIETEEYSLKLYEKCRSGDTQRLVADWTIFGEQVEGLFMTGYFCVMHGWDVTLDKIAGTDRAITWSLRSYGTPTEYASATETISTTEHSLVTDTAGPDQTTDDKGLQVWIETFALADGDLYQIRAYEKAQSGDTQRLAWTRQILGGQAQGMLVIPVHGFLHGWDVTMVKVSGTDRAINWSLRAVA